MTPRAPRHRPPAGAALVTAVLTALAAGATLPGRPAAAQGAPGDVRLTALRTEHLTDPVGLGERAPRLSWKLVSARRGTLQSAYQLRVADDSAALAGRPLWDTGRVPSDSSLLRPYAGPALASGRRYWWQVRVWDDQGRPSAWSAPAFWETGLLEPGDWTARWITPALPEDTTRSNPSPMLRRDFALDGGRIVAARLYVTSRGLHEVEINGRRVGDQLFAPGWTSYDHRLQYLTHDVTALVRPGANAVGAVLGDGWYRGRLGFETQRNTYGHQLGLLAQLVVRYADGRTQVVGTDDRWRAATGPIVQSDIYDGETYDARLERPGWSRPGYDARAWRPVRPMAPTRAALVAPAAPPVRRVEERRPARVFRTPAGETVFDFGQNMVGWVRLRARGPAGTRVRLRHAEALDKAGNLYTANLRSAKATDEFVLRGAGADEVFEPRFTFHGFRYVAVEGYPGAPDAGALTGVVLHSDLPRTGAFATSSPMLDRLQRNIVWGQRGNFLDVPTDTPARDERLGWTGDAQAFAPTAAFNYDVSGFFAKWLADLALDQRASGAVPDVVPNVLKRHDPAGHSAAGWGDAGTIIPWAMYLHYGDRRLLERQYPSMRRLVEFQRAQAGDSLLWKSGWHYGDWLAFATTRSDYPGATTDKDLIATAFFAHSADLVARAAAALGRADDARRYRDLFGRVRAAFAREYVTASGRLSSNTQTAYALALEFDLLPPGLRAAAGARLAADVRAFGHLTTGFLGTPHLAPALTRAGHADLAYQLLLREKYPSWLYPVTQGATTMWERWDGVKPDSTFQDVGMNSFNHYAYGAVGAWMYATLAGLDVDPDEPAYRHAIIAPRPGGGLTAVRATLETPYGPLGSAWEIGGGRFQLTVRVPANARATVWLPEARLAAVTESGAGVARAAGVRAARQEGDAVVVEVGSGEYRFAYATAMTGAAPAPAATPR
jgi:alpha-L-rhamnosidase